MLIRATDLPDPPTGDPFLHDKLDRKQYAEPLTQLVENTPDPFVLAVDGGWGTGKTSFLRMWCRHLEDRGHRCLYFSAWKNDFAVDPLAALVAELTADLEKDSSPLSDRSQKILAELKKVANVLSRRFASAAIASSLYSLWSSRSPNEPDEHQQALENFSNSAGEVVSDAVGSYLAGRRDLEKFRSLLSDLVAELADQDPKGSPRKVVLFVDELDRCRPLYALELLERVKHLFDVSGVAFVLGLDLDQLAHGVRAVNGGSFDAPGYLRRFIDHRQRLADPPLDRLGDLPIWSTIEALCSDRKFLEDVKTPKKYLLAVFQASRMSLRTQIQTISLLSLLLRLLPANRSYCAAAMATLVFVHEWRAELYRGVFERELGIDELYGALNELLDFRPEVQRSEASDGDRHAIFAIEAAVLSGATQLERTCQVLERLKARLEAAKQEAGGHEDARVRRMIQLLTYSRRLSYRFEGSEVLREDFQEIRDALRFVAPFRLEP